MINRDTAKQFLEVNGYPNPDSNFENEMIDTMVEYALEQVENNDLLHSVSESLLAKCWNCQYFETRGKNYAKNTIGHCHKQDCKVSYPKHQYCDKYKQSDNFR